MPTNPPNWKILMFLNLNFLVGDYKSLFKPVLQNGKCLNCLPDSSKVIVLQVITW